MMITPTSRPRIDLRNISEKFQYLQNKSEWDHLSPSSLPGYHFLAFILQAILFCLHGYVVGLHVQWARTLGLGLCCMILAPDEQVVFRAVGSRYESMMGAGASRRVPSHLWEVQGQLPMLGGIFTQCWWQSLWESGKLYLWVHAALSPALCNHLHTFLYALPLKTLCMLNWVCWNFSVTPSSSNCDNYMSQEGIGLNCMDSKFFMFFSSYIHVKDF